MMHDVILHAQKLITNTDLSRIVDVQKCRAHRHTEHNFFLSYRVSSEGTKCPFSQVVWWFYMAKQSLFSYLSTGTGWRTGCHDLQEVGIAKKAWWKRYICLSGQTLSQVWPKLARWISFWLEIISSHCFADVQQGLCKPTSPCDILILLLRHYKEFAKMRLQNKTMY